MLRSTIVTLLLGVFLFVSPNTWAQEEEEEEIQARPNPMEIQGKTGRAEGAPQVEQAMPEGASQMNAPRPEGASQLQQGAAKQQKMQTGKMQQGAH